MCVCVRVAARLVASREKPLLSIKQFPSEPPSLGLSCASILLSPLPSPHNSSSLAGLPFSIRRHTRAASLSLSGPTYILIFSPISARHNLPFLFFPRISPSDLPPPSSARPELHAACRLIRQILSANFRTKSDEKKCSGARWVVVVAGSDPLVRLRRGGALVLAWQPELLASS